MRMSLQKKFGWIHVRGGKVLRVATGHAVPTNTYHEEAAAAARDLIKQPGKALPGERFAGARAVFCQPRDLAVELVNVKNGRVMGWSYLTGPAANLHHYGVGGDLSVGAAQPWEPDPVPVARWVVPMDGDSDVVMGEMRAIRGQDRYGIVAFNLAVTPGAESDFGRAIAEMWSYCQHETKDAGGPEPTAHLLGIINGGKKHSTHVGLHFQVKEHASDWPANPFQMGLVLSAPDLPVFDIACAPAA